MTLAVITRLVVGPGSATLPASMASVEDQPDLVGVADFEVVTDDVFEEDPAGDRGVEHLGQGELGLQDRHVVAVASSPVVVGERVRQDRHRLSTKA